MPGEVRPVVADAMLRHPKICDATTTLGRARELLRDDHVHALLVVDDHGLLRAVVEREDLAEGAADTLAEHAGRLADRTVGPHVDLVDTQRRMRRNRRRRLAVVDGRGRLLGLLCLKRSGTGFCSDDGVRARAAESRRGATPSAR
ncbi:CBS domain-containing protein [Pseudonocardia sp.]|uniref:CBS domain-containing protein n=1 Tax=Pseudonocardia sp. TaxID=60912 RepID=UPI003D1023B2